MKRSKTSGASRPVCPLIQLSTSPGPQNLTRMASTVLSMACFPYGSRDHPGTGGLHGAPGRYGSCLHGGGTHLHPSANHRPNGHAWHSALANIPRQRLLNMSLHSFRNNSSAIYAHLGEFNQALFLIRPHFQLQDRPGTRPPLGPYANWGSFKDRPHLSPRAIWLNPSLSHTWALYRSSP